jgi:hypothetical protein
MRAALDEDLTASSLGTEAAYLASPEHRGFERPYGWGWALALADELAHWDDADAARWREHMQPLNDVIRDRFLEWLPKATYPLRTGLHGNSAFGLLLALAFARSDTRGGRGELEAAFTDAARRWFTNDVDYPAAWEPSGSDFLSPALTEATLMSELMPRDEFAAWLDHFLPSLVKGEPASLLRPAIVSDPTDGQIAHLHGLNLSRAFCMHRIAGALPDGDVRVSVLSDAAERHTAASLDAAVGSDYMVEHWLAAYAVLLLG